MKQDRFVSRSLMVPLCVLAMVLFAGSAWALGINFSVLTGASGQPGTAVNATSGDGADIYVGGAGTNVIRIPKAALGLQPGDEVDAISIMGGDPVYFDVLGGGLPILFSVDATAVGVPGPMPPDVTTEAGAGEAAGDAFWSTPFSGFNSQLFDEALIGLVGPGVPLDDQDALDLDGPILSYPLPMFSLGFSLAAGSPSLVPGPGGINSSDIFTPNGAGGFMVVYWPAFLGLKDDADPAGGDDIDALYIDGWMIPVFSVAPGGGSGLMPGDLFVPDGYGVFPPPGPPDGVADMVLPAPAIGLQPVDNLNALDMAVVLPILPPAPDEVDTDGDTLPDYWEEREGLDPNDDGSVDPDMGADGDPDNDTYTNKDEYDNGTHPQISDMSVMRPWPVTVVVALAVIALAAVALTYRKRLA